MAGVEMHDARTHLSELVERAEAGEDVVIQRNGKPAVRLMPVVEKPRSLASVRGAWRGRVHMAEDCDLLPEDSPRHPEGRIVSAFANRKDPKSWSA